MSPQPPKPSSLPPVPCRRSTGGVTVEVRVQPRASRLAVEGVEGEVLKVRLTAPPADGEANAQLVKLLAKTFGVSKSSVRIIKGETSRTKVVEFSGAVPAQFEIRE